MNDVDEKHMHAALELARKGYGRTSPNPMVGALLVKGRAVIGTGWHRKAGGVHAEIEALNDARRNDYNIKAATLYVTLEPCSTSGRTPSCTHTIIESRLKRVVIAATDPNPKHSGNAYRLLRKAGIEVRKNILEEEATDLNAAFNHWITHRTPFVTVKAAMTLDGKIAKENGESKWITSEAARRKGMHLRRGSDAILVGIETVLADNPSLTIKGGRGVAQLRRVVLDSRARTPLDAKIIRDGAANSTTVVVLKGARHRSVVELRKRVMVVEAPARHGRIDLKWLLKRLGRENISNLLVEGGGEVNAAFLNNRLAQRVAFFYAPKILGGSRSRSAVGGNGMRNPREGLRLSAVEWRRVGPDLLLTARVEND